MWLYIDKFYIPYLFTLLSLIIAWDVCTFTILKNLYIRKKTSVSERKHLSALCMHHVQTRGFPHTSCSGHWHKLSKQGQIICLFNLVFNVWFLFSFSHWFLFSIKLKLVLDQLQDKCKIIYNAVVEKVVYRYMCTL